MVIPPGKKLMFQSIPTWPTVDAKGRILETLTLARRLLVAKKCPSVPQWKNPNPKIWKKKTLMSPAWNAWGKLLIAYKATKVQSKGKRKKKHTKRSKQKTYCGNYLPIQFWSPLNPQSVTPQKVDSENQSCTCTCAPGKQPGICPCHPCIAPGKATICAFRSWERRQAN